MRRLIALPLVMTLTAGGQPAPLQIETIMQGPRYAGYAPEKLRWSGDGKRLYFNWKRHTDAIHAPVDTYVVDRDGGNLLKLSEAEARLSPPERCQADTERKRCVYEQEGDIWLYDYTVDRGRRLVATREAEQEPEFLPGGQEISYQRGQNLYVQSLADGSVEQVTDNRTGKPPAEEEETKKDAKKTQTSQEYLKEEEKLLLGVVKERAERKEAERAREKRRNARKPFYLPARHTAIEQRLVGNRKYVVALLREAPEGVKKTVVPNYVSESGYTEELTARNKVGDLQARTKLYVINTETGEAREVDLGLGAGGKAVAVTRLAVSEDRERVAFLARSTDNKDLWRMALDLVAAKGRVLTQDHDEAWIGGPGTQQIGFLGDQIFYQSEVSGYSHLYLQPFAGGTAKALTSGNWEVTGVELSWDRKRFYLTTSEASPYERHFYSLDPATGAKERYTTAAGKHEVTLSPDEKYLGEIYSYANKPEEVYVGEKQAGAKAVQVTSSPSPEFLARKWVDPAIVEIPARDGKKVPGRLYKAANGRRGGPAVIFVHGAGYLQNVHRWWSSYFREYMFHHILMANGYTVLDIDYRASAGYGRDWRTGVYRHMGGKDLEDQLDAAKWLVTVQGVNARKIGIYGGSYGGFITLMALFTSPDTFAAGAALRPVTDWAHYNHPYTANILNEPQRDGEAYRKSSPIYHAAGLKGALLICHGMVDVNVHYQDSVRLAQKLIELGKENWELASYPVEDHGFVEPSSWTDEYRRIFKLFEKNLK
ncbi:MAG: prolyl oligopeptidase family serine peptidase [Bryobacter sp.]|jgi:dipeptidyl aminopeptidase/acylaminoacyl peptidase|nr:prolyl oligopeptidase family serine peptidase [Bryobacter sp. CoA8 C33]